jgi:enoyl-[acyl-carrier-protein] reductase (NADH)
MSLTGVETLTPEEISQIAETATFLASDRAGAITSGMVNATCGLIAR